jgi:recombination protein RecT
MNGPNTVAVYDPAAQAKTLTRLVRSKKGAIADLLGADPDTERGKAMIDRFITVALHAATSDAKILRATPESVVQAIRDSALLGLEPVGITGDGAIVVYEETTTVERPGSRPGTTIMVQQKVPIAHFQPMYRGLLKLARRSDQLAHIDAHVVYRGDTIELDLGSSPSVKHYPVLDGAERGDVVGAYAVAETKEGRRYVEWMTHADIEQVRSSSRGGSKPDSPWVRFWSEMARKTVLRRLMKRLPLETMAEHGLRLEAETESGGRSEAVPVAELEAPAESTARRRLRSRFVADPAETAPAAAPTGIPAVLVPEPTDTAPDPDPTRSGLPTGSEAPETAPEIIEGVAVDVSAPQTVCGATSDPQLGTEEVCVLEPGHAFPDGAKSAHQSKEGSRWPNR